MDLEHAIEKHAEWKVRFRSAIARHETVDEGTIARTDRCELGKWLHGEAGMRLGSFNSYHVCVSSHAAFHAEAAKVAHAVNARDYAAAEALLESGTAYAEASGAVAVAILRLKKEAGL